MNIYLIGYRCTGKTTVGKMLASALGFDFIDADVKLVKDYGMTVAEIVAKEGWGGFRSKEKDVLKEISQMKNHVIATGGGVILDPENIDTIKNSGICVFLKASPEIIQERMLKDAMTADQRPSLTDKKLEQEITYTLRERMPLYEKTMDFSVDTDELSLDDVTSMTLRGLEDKL